MKRKVAKTYFASLAFPRASSKEHFHFVAMATLTVFAIVIFLFLFKLKNFGDSDIWWYGVLFQVQHYANSDVWLYGAITGVFGWLFLILLGALAFLYFKRIKENSKRRR